jgi:hypothetical protein
LGLHGLYIKEWLEEKLINSHCCKFWGMEYYLKLRGDTNEKDTLLVNYGCYGTISYFASALA